MRKRVFVAQSVLWVCLFALIARFGYIHFSMRHFLRDEGEDRIVRTVVEQAHRGTITDRHGTALAVSTPVNTVIVDPTLVKPTRTCWLHVLQSLGLDVEATHQKLARFKHKRFMYLTRQVEPHIADYIAMQRCPGIAISPSQKRYYPDAEVTAHIIGFANVDGVGQEGIEYTYDDWLTGEDGYQKIEKDLKGNIVNAPEELTPQSAGKPIALSIDRRLQFITYFALKKAVTQHQADSGSAVLMDIHTGEILAMVNQPSFNPNNRNSLDPGEGRNRAITDTFEPGSVIKTFAAGAALMSGLYTMEDEIDTSPGFINIGGHIVRDGQDMGKLTVRDIIKVSSNVGISTLVTTIPEETLPTLLQRFGFGQDPGLHFPGARSGVFPKKKKWQPFELATMSFGYGFSANTLQLALAYGAIGNGGVLMKPTLLRLEKRPAGNRILPPEIANQLLQLLDSVVEEGGTGEKASIKNYDVAGKTGTSRQAAEGGYALDRYNAQFVGIGPLSSPKLVLAVSIQNPKGNLYYGGSVAAPVFAEVLQTALPILGIAPDASAKYE